MFYYETNANPPADVFERLMQRGMIKLKIAYDEPLMYEFLFGAFINTPAELNGELQEIYSRLYAENMERFYSGLDTSKLREDVDINKAIEIITIFLDGLSNKYITLFKNSRSDDVLKDMDKIMKETGTYLDILKKGIYK